MQALNSMFNALILNIVRVMFLPLIARDASYILWVPMRGEGRCMFLGTGSGPSLIEGAFDCVNGICVGLGANRDRLVPFLAAKNKEEFIRQVQRADRQGDFRVVPN